jgi:hypothetical protein
MNKLQLQGGLLGQVVEWLHEYNAHMLMQNKTVYSKVEISGQTTFRLYSVRYRTPWLECLSLRSLFTSVKVFITLGPGHGDDDGGDDRVPDEEEEGEQDLAQVHRLADQQRNFN